MARIEYQITVADYRGSWKKAKVRRAMSPAGLKRKAQECRN